MKIHLIIPPFVQPNAPFPSVFQLSGFLRANNIDASASDLSINVLLKIFSENGLKKVFEILESRKIHDEFSRRFLSLKNSYINTIDSVIEFLQGKNPNLAQAIVETDFLPKGNSFGNSMDEFAAFGNLGLQDKAKYYCTLYLEDLINLIKKKIDRHFGFSRYAEKISVSLPAFDPMLNELKKPFSIVDEYLFEEIEKIIVQKKPDFFAISIPFPGNLFSALRIGEYLKQNYPGIKIIFGGGFVNTELREIKDTRIFDFTDFITLDDGELPILNILRNYSPKNSDLKWVRTFVKSGNKILFLNSAAEKNIKHENLPTPDFTEINPNNYLTIIEVLNPMHRMWTDGYWNKLTLAHGCYWHKCTFCDTQLDYIKRYSVSTAEKLVDQIEEIILITKRNSFHFTDEAAPPNLLKELALELIKRKVKISWWGNVRFEKTFTADLCKLLAASGCIAVSGGIEAAEKRLLKIINKGVTVEQAANVFKNFRQAGVLVHAYLMFGYPTQTELELSNSLEIVRQFFVNDLINSAYWHRFSLTCHSEIYLNPKKFNIKIISKPLNSFANNDLIFEDKSGIDFSKYSEGLKKSLYNFMNGIGLEWDIENWFEFEIKSSTIQKDFIKNILEEKKHSTELTKRGLWLGGKPNLKKYKSGNSIFSVHTNDAVGEWKLRSEIADWLNEFILTVGNPENKISVNKFAKSFPGNFKEFIKTEIWKELREIGLLLI